MDKFDHAVAEMAAIVAETDVVAKSRRLDTLLGYMADNFDPATVAAEDMAVRKLFSGPVKGDYTAETLRAMPEGMTPLVIARLLLTRHRVPFLSLPFTDRPGCTRFRDGYWRLLVGIRRLR